MAKKPNKPDTDSAPLAPIAAVRLATPGVKACGPYQAGQVYRVPADLSLEEAHRLVRVKGFTALSDAEATAPAPESTQADKPAEQPEA